MKKTKQLPTQTIVWTMRNPKILPIFGVLTDGGCTHFAGQAVKLLNNRWAFFMPSSYRRLPIRKIKGFLFGVKYTHLLAAYMAAAFCCPKMSNL